MALDSVCSSWSVLPRTRPRLRRIRSSRSTERTMAERVAAVLLDLAHAPGGAHQDAAADHESHAEQAARNEHRGSPGTGRGCATRRTSRAGCNEAEDDERHADRLEPLAHVAAAAARARPVHHGGEALQARRYRGGAVGLTLGRGGRGGRHDHGPGQPADVGTGADLGHLARVGPVGRPSKDWHQPKPPKSFISSGVTLKRSMSGSPSEHEVPRGSARSSARLYR